MTSTTTPAADCAIVAGVIAANLCTVPGLVRCKAIGTRMVVLCTAEPGDQKRLVGAKGANIDALITVAEFLGVSRACFKLIEPVHATALTGEAPPVASALEAAKIVFDIIGGYSVDGEEFAEGTLITISPLPGARQVGPEARGAFLHLFRGIDRRRHADENPNFDLTIEWT